MNLISDAVDIGLGNIHRILDLWRAGKSDSLIDYTRPTRVEPIVLIDSDCLFHDALPDVQQTLLSTFAGYYLQAVAISATVGKVHVMRQLDKLNPNRNAVDSAVDAGVTGGAWLMAQENYKLGLPKIPKLTAAMESQSVYDVLPMKISLEARDDKTPAQHTEFSTGKDSITTIKELSNLSVGKLLSVEITDGNHKASIPVAIRLMASTLPSDSIAHLLSVGKKDTSVKARWHGWRSGRLKFWEDLVFCEDLIEEHRNGLMKDKDGMYRQILARKRKNTLAGVLSGNPSVATASNMAVISKETADKIELETVGNLNNFATRQKLFEPTSLMILAVIAKDYDRVTFYYRGIAEKTEVSVRDLRASNKGSGSEVTDILKAFVSGSAPSL
jgi:hypothetical protein